MNDIALRRPRKSALLWCRHEDIRPLRDERYKRCVLVVILYFALRNAREGLGKTALTASTAGLGGAGTAQGGRSISLSPAASVPVSMTGNSSRTPRPWRECHLHARNLLGEAGYR